MGHAPSQQFAIAGRQQQAGARELRPGTNQRLQVFVRFPYRMSEKAQRARVAADPPGTLHDLGCAMLYSFAQLALAVVAVDAITKPIAGLYIALVSRAHAGAGNLNPERLTLHVRDRLANFESELGVETERPVVVGGLVKPYAGESAFLGALDHVDHQLAADLLILNLRVDRNRTHARDLRALVEKVAAGNLTVQLSHDRVEAGMREKH